MFLLSIIICFGVLPLFLLKYYKFEVILMNFARRRKLQYVTNVATSIRLKVNVLVLSDAGKINTIGTL